MATLNALPLEIVRMIFEHLYDQVHQQHGRNRAIAALKYVRGLSPTFCKLSWEVAWIRNRGVLLGEQKWRRMWFLEARYKAAEIKKKRKRSDDIALIRAAKQARPE